jgi:hypothetical protein
MKAVTRQMELIAGSLADNRTNNWNIIYVTIYRVILHGFICYYKASHLQLLQKQMLSEVRSFNILHYTEIWPRKYDLIRSIYKATCMFYCLDPYSLPVQPTPRSLLHNHVPNLQSWNYPACNNWNLCNRCPTSQHCQTIWCLNVGKWPK